KWLDTIYIAVILLQGTYTPLVYAHDGRTQQLSMPITESHNLAEPTVMPGMIWKRNILHLNVAILEKNWIRLAAVQVIHYG
ncbi:MAG: hypothetical protein KZQ70_13960, partial [gamma proteobacterium symbiont of Lucinoma myriamae]|nr:hypothetical protein [gamma proteobacterium symbiont of Lucinoma myriamae]MCU7819432.1 hypothetical protein [gamma proteobacterium symbiont of Lucinoma myriamae]MCU7833381.1 hypothetical protein [gamma proteobacterium symbiont of Lucinoma myriamae]